MPEPSNHAKRTVPDHRFWPLDPKRKQPYNFRNLQYLWMPVKSNVGMGVLHWISYYGHVGDPYGAIFSASHLVREAGYEVVYLEMPEGFKLTIRKDSSPSDLYDFYKLNVDFKKLQSYVVTLELKLNKKE